MGTTREGRPRVGRRSRSAAALAVVALGVGALGACGSDTGPTTAAASSGVLITVTATP